MKPDTPTILALGASTGLGIPSAAAFVVWLGNPGLFPSTLLEGLVFGIMLLRVALFFALPGLRELSAGTSVIFFSAEILIVPVALTALIQTGNVAYGEFGGAFLASWLSSSMLVYPVVAAFLIVRSVRQRFKLYLVLPSAAASFGISSLVLEALGNGLGVGGISGVAQVVLRGLGKPIVGVPWASELIAGCGTFLFVSLAAYSVTGSRRVGDRLTAELVLSVGGIGALLVWLALAPPLYAWVTLGLPTMLIVGGLWVVTRGG